MKTVRTRNPLWLAFLLFFMLGGISGVPQADQILGRWLFPSKGSSVEIYRIGARYFARVAEVDQAGEKNYGLVRDKPLIRNLTYDGQAWSAGELEHPKTGVIHTDLRCGRVKMKMAPLRTDDELKR
ncbi:MULTISPECIES: hypothetical protein [Spirosoma]|uniref:DUF2147 domain-containing protein n=1 Tax=Spirosoma liriopis TaxID=2937440 RepID=A0ABT0HTZ0_9BACT|nr:MULTISPECIES: hypothetical protein [Spirosoma]MCK8495609.1 hypothetical protein [Spirosoma liriopis]UHG94545.1 hypothetical protein LQ777_28570 [Spirosoma oryzicola]